MKLIFDLIQIIKCDIFHITKIVSPINVVTKIIVFLGTRVEGTDPDFSQAEVDRSVFGLNDTSIGTPGMLYEASFTLRYRYFVLSIAI